MSKRTKPVRQFFDLDFPQLIVLLAAIGIVALAILVLEASDRIAPSLRALFGGRQGDGATSGVGHT